MNKQYIFRLCCFLFLNTLPGPLNSYNTIPQYSITQSEIDAINKQPQSLDTAEHMKALEALTKLVQN